MTSLYEIPSKKLWLLNFLKTFLIPDSLERISAKNKLTDYKSMIPLAGNKLWCLHKNLEVIQQDMKANYTSYDYGNGYYYQSMQTLNISGYRNTEDRIEKLNLKEIVKNKIILDIGSNSGFILLSLANEIKNGVGVELNPYLVASSKEVQNFLQADNINFISNCFEDYKSDKPQFNVALSLANHSTYDGNTQQSIDNYFYKIFDLLLTDGILVFESHPPQHEPKEMLDKTISIIEKYFDIEDRPQINMKGFLDKNRTYIIARKKQLV